MFHVLLYWLEVHHFRYVHSLERKHAVVNPLSPVCCRGRGRVSLHRKHYQHWLLPPGSQGWKFSTCWRKVCVLFTSLSTKHCWLLLSWVPVLIMFNKRYHFVVYYRISVSNYCSENLWLLFELLFNLFRVYKISLYILIRLQFYIHINLLWIWINAYECVQYTINTCCLIISCSNMHSGRKKKKVFWANKYKDADNRIYLLSMSIEMFTRETLCCSHYFVSPSIPKRNVTSLICHNMNEYGQTLSVSIVCECILLQIGDFLLFRGKCCLKVEKSSVSLKTTLVSSSIVSYCCNRVWTGGDGLAKTVMPAGFEPATRVYKPGTLPLILNSLPLFINELELITTNIFVVNLL